jgi:hypothetical protein
MYAAIDDATLMLDVLHDHCVGLTGDPEDAGQRLVQPGVESLPVLEVAG